VVKVPTVRAALRRFAPIVGAGIAGAVGRPAFWVAAVVVLLGIPLGIGLGRRPPVPPPVLGTLPAFSLVDQQGQPFDTERMRGKVWIADFIFTRCPTSCPRLTARMAMLQRRLRNMGGEVRLASFSVDPEYDTPARLDEYAQRAHANPRVWTFVTGKLGAMEQAVVGGFKVAMGRDAPDDLLSIVHGEHLVLVDRHLRIRGYYEASDEASDRLVRAAALLASVDR
jgi:protein SCO1